MHILQTKAWGDFKEAFGTEVVRAGGVQYTKHKIPFIGRYVAYCPRIDPTNIAFDELKESLKRNNCVYINFDVPNVIIKASTQLGVWSSIFAPEKESRLVFKNLQCVKSPKDTFARGNVLIDLTKSEAELLEDMHPKRRYNIKLAQKKGVKVKTDSSKAGFEVFYQLLKETATLQKYFIHPKEYYEKVWEILGPNGEDKLEILTSYYEKTPLASWMLFFHDNVLYYPYGGSSAQMRDLHASELLGWEVMLYGKSNGCELFDMWGAAVEPLDEKDEYFGFTQFKQRYGGTHVVYLELHDYVCEPFWYALFNLANDIRWKILKRSL